VTVPEHVAVCADLFDIVEKRLGLPDGALGMEIMIETPQSVLAPSGAAAPLSLAQAGRGRCVAAHFGTYDYTASCNVTAAHQKMSHAACDFAKHVMQVSLAGTGVWISDGATNVMPVDDGDAVRAAWRLHYDDVRRSLVAGYYQGWDLHPAQLVTRYAAVHAFFLEGLAAATERLSNFVAKAAQATLVGDVFDDTATGQGLLNYFVRGVSCGALREDEALAAGVTLDELRGRSFLKILKGRARG
jgi:uncharacterized protein DUF6986